MPLREPAFIFVCDGPAGVDVRLMKTDCEGKKDPTEVLESPQIAEPFILMLS